MGRVFSLEEIKEKKVPEIESFEIVIEKAREKLSNDRNVIGAVHCGSTLPQRNDFSVRSDIDLFVLYNDERIFSTIQEIILFAKNLFVPVDFMPLDIKMAKMNIHPFNDDYFSSHVKWAAKHGGAIKRNPFEVLEIKETNPEIVLKAFFTVITKNLERSICELLRFDGEKKYILLGKILEAPIKMVGYILYSEGKSAFSWQKQEIIKDYLANVGNSHLIEILQELIKVDRDYTEILNKISQSPHIDSRDQKTYKEMLYWIERNATPKVMEFIKDNAVLAEKKEN
jgi:predicted nucleotidyltransferase